MMRDGSGFWIFQIGISAIALLLWVIPIWKVLKRTGNVPALALLGFVPILGPLIVLFVLAYGRWPRFEPLAEG